jgi:hypothetical protein
VAHAREVAQIPLQVGLEIGPVEQVAVECRVGGDGRVRAAPDQRIQLAKLEWLGIGRARGQRGVGLGEVQRERVVERDVAAVRLTQILEESRLPDLPGASQEQDRKGRTGLPGEVRQGSWQRHCVVQCAVSLQHRRKCGLL